MKLRFSLTRQQLLSAAGCALLLVSAAGAQDVIVGADGQARQVKVVGVTPTGTLEFLVGQGKLGLALASVKEVRMAAPPEFAAGMQAFQARDYAKALNYMKGLADKFKGLPTPWAQQAAGMLGDLYISLNDLPKAEAAYGDFKRLYPGGGSLQSDVGLSRLAVAKKDFATAKQKLAPITEAALRDKVVNAANATAYSQAFLVSGQLKEGEGNLAGALEDYLRTVTIFYHDRAAVSVAQERADALRKDHKEITVP